MQTQSRRNTPPSGRRWRRRSVLTWSGGVATIVDVVLARGTDAGSLRALRATCTTLRDTLSDVTAFRLREQCAHELRVLPKTGALKAITAVLVEEDSDGEEDPHLQLDEEGRVDVASLYGSWDQYVVSEDNWRVPWPRRGGGRWSWEVTGST